MNTTTKTVVAFDAATSPVIHTGWRSHVVTVTNFISKHFSRTRLTAVALVAAFIWLLAPTGAQGSGGIVEIEKNLNVLVVHNGYSNRLVDFVQWVGLPNLSHETNDRFISTANAYGAAQQLVNGVSTKGLMLSVTEGSRAWDAGLRSHDIVSEIKFAPGCEQFGEIGLAWVRTYGCESILTVARDGKFLHLPIRAHDSLGASSVKVNSNMSADGPRQLNMTSGMSAGLALSLQFTDKFTEGSLFSTDHVAVTGAVHPRTGLVTRIEGLPAKAEAAYRSGATILLVPQGQAKEVPHYVGMPVYEVASTEHAVHLLCQRGAQDSICNRFHTSP